MIDMQLGRVVRPVTIPLRQPFSVRTALSDENLAARVAAVSVLVIPLREKVPVVTGAPFLGLHVERRKDRQ